MRTLILIPLCLSISIQGALTGEDASDSTENGHEFFDGLQVNYSNAFVDVIATFQNITSTLATIACKMHIMEKQITASTNRMEQMESNIEGVQAYLQSRLQAIDTRMERLDYFTIHYNKTLSRALRNIETLSSKRDQNLVNVEVYEGSNFSGDMVKINSEDSIYCFNLVSVEQNKARYNFNDRITSIKFEGNCIRLHEHLECQGKSLQLLRGVRVDCQKDLGKCGFKNTVTSISACY